jgi:Secretion system C-terminal sorting domain
VLAFFLDIFNSHFTAKPILLTSLHLRRVYYCFRSTLIFIYLSKTTFYKMANFKKIVMLIAILIIGKNAIAQTRNISTKILKSIGLAEVHHVIPNADGYFVIGSKGEDVLHKKLWLIQLDANMKIKTNEVVHNFDITTPIKYTLLKNGQMALLAQEQINENGAERSLLFTINTQHQIEKTIVLNSSDRTNYSALTSIDNKIILAGVALHPAEKALANDAISIASISENGNIEWVKNYNVANSQIKIGDLMIDDDGNFLCTGSGLEVSGANAIVFQNSDKNFKEKTIEFTEYDDAKITVLNNNNNNPTPTSSKVYTKFWFAQKFSVSGDLLHTTLINNYANYNPCGSLISYSNGYAAVLNAYNYFGAPMIVMFDKNLNVTASNQIGGAPIIISGLIDGGKDLILGAIYSNDINHYSPGYIIIRKSDLKITAKSSTLLFDFFMMNTVHANSHGFTVAGNGYMHNQFSDVYIYPFDADGNGVCDYANQDVALENKSAEVAYTQENSATNSNITLEPIKAVTEKSDIQLSSVCNTADDLIVPKENNKNWKDWNKNNQAAFVYQVPAKWIRVYPNPTNGIIKIEYLAARSDVLQTSIYNQFGSIIQTKIISNHDVFQLDINALPAGKYFIKINDGKAELVESIIKQ